MNKRNYNNDAYLNSNYFLNFPEMCSAIIKLLVAAPLLRLLALKNKFNVLGFE